MGEKCLPGAQFAFVHEIHDKHTEWVEAKLSKLLRESILPVDIRN
jgi:hypothetical protein